MSKERSSAEIWEDHADDARQFWLWHGGLESRSVHAVGVKDGMELWRIEMKERGHLRAAFHEAFKDGCEEARFVAKWNESAVRQQGTGGHGDEAVAAGGLADVMKVRIRKTALDSDYD